MRIEVEEEDLIYLLRCADRNADYDECEIGDDEEARETRSRIKRVVSGANRQLGFRKYFYDFERGIWNTQQEEK